MAELSDLTAACIRCGFCLESCPTFRITGDESESPRGRIYLARSLDEGKIGWDADSRRALDTCVGCRACETACPSAVRYGEILEQTRSLFEASSPRPKLRRFLNVLTQPNLLRPLLGLAGAFGMKRPPSFLTRGLSREPQQADLPRLPQGQHWPLMDASECPKSRGIVTLLEGCAMGVLFPSVHEATERLLRRVGFECVRAKGCCGALHAHSGYLADGQLLASKIRAQSVLVANAAGCGSWLKEARPNLDVLDVTEFLVQQGLREALATSEGLEGQTVTYQDACHLAHGQSVRDAPRQLLSAVPGLQVTEHKDPDRCCGSGGVYNILQPGRARKMRDEKWSNVAEIGAEFMVTANPGCHTWLGQAARESGGQTRVVHILSLLEASFSGVLEES